MKIGERATPDKVNSVEGYLSLLRHKFAYEQSVQYLNNNYSVLEIGSGEGYGTSFLSSHVKNIIGLDVYHDVVMNATAKYERNNCQFIQHTEDKFPFEQNSFDAIILFQVIEHIEDDQNFILEIFNLLKPGGVFISTTPNRIYRLKDGEKPWNHFHIREYYPEEYESLLRKIFTDTKIKGIRANDEVQKIEIAAVRKGFGRIDKFNIRKIVPDFAKLPLLNLYRYLTNQSVDSNNLQNAIKKYSTDDYFLIEDDLNDSLDLFSICIK